MNPRSYNSERYALLPAIVAAVVFCYMGGGALAADRNIALINRGFERPTIGEIRNGFDAPGRDVPGWTNSGRRAYSNSGVALGKKFGGNSSYVCFLYKKDSSVIQLTNHPIAVGETFTLAYLNMNGQITAEGAAAGRGSLYFIDDTGERCTLGSVATSRRKDQPDNYWSDATLTVAATPESVGKYLGIEFKGTDGWLVIDDVSLTYTPGVPP